MIRRLTNRDVGLIMGALRRVFARSELRQQVVAMTVVKSYADPDRKRVKTWCKCQACGAMTARSYMQVDHVLPVVPLDSSLEQMSWDQVIERLWCPISNLQAICKPCHKTKTAAENKRRRQYKKGDV